MKKLSALSVAMLAVIFFALVALPLAFAASSTSSGTKPFTQQVTLLSGATGTTSAYTVSAFTFDIPVNNIACDIISSQTNSTTNATISFYGNQGSSTTLFDTVMSASTLTTTWVPGSLTTSTIRSFAKTTNPIRTIEAIVTAPVATTVYTINCSGTL